MATDDFYISAAQQRAAQIDAERAAALADLQAHRASGDRDSASEAVQRIANLDAERSNLEGLYQRYVASQQPYTPPPMTDAESWNHMNWDDVVELTRTSKYAKHIDSRDPMMVAGWHEVQRRKARGE
jgi:hypothetical protein